MSRFLLAVFAAILASIPASAQDPQDVLNQLIRQQQQKLADQQRQRQLDQQEADYDRQMCLKVGYVGPDVEQCVRASAEWRRALGTQESSPPDFAAYGTVAQNAPQAGGTVCAIVAAPAKFDHQTVLLDGVVTNLNETTSQRGNDYTTFKLQDASGCGAVTIFSWGHPTLTEGACVHASGLFETEHHAGKYVFKNEVSASSITLCPK